MPLAGNELEKARDYRDRYYIYRVYEEEVGQEWKVVELANPLEFDWEVTYDVDLLRCSEARCWAVEPAVTDSQDKPASP